MKPRLRAVPSPAAGGTPQVDVDAELEGLIAHVGRVLVATRDRRYVAIQRTLHSMRSARQVVRMEAAAGLPSSTSPEAA